jgi:hypothetical protein
MKHYLNNILIIDHARFQRTHSYRYDGITSSLAIVLVESQLSYWVEKNRYGRDGYSFEKHRLPEFLLDPSKNYERQRPADDYGIVERVPAFVEGECTCHIAPPCSFCTSMTEEEANIFASGGLDALRQYRRGLTESLT